MYAAYCLCKTALCTNTHASLAGEFLCLSGIRSQEPHPQEKVGLWVGPAALLSALGNSHCLWKSYCLGLRNAQTTYNKVNCCLMAVRSRSPTCLRQKAFGNSSPGVGREWGDGHLSRYHWSQDPECESWENPWVFLYSYIVIVLKYLKPRPPGKPKR